MPYTCLETIFRNSAPVYLFTLTRMIPVAEAEGVRLHCPEAGRYAFYNSPYPAHKLNTGVDIYPGEVFGGEALSPVDGEVIMTRIVKAPRGRGFKAADHDSVIIIRNRDNEVTVTKLLHVDPLVEVGDTVRKGGVVGTTLRSGYYGGGTSPHLHVEIRRLDDPIRARGGYNLSRIGNTLGRPVESLSGEVVHVQQEFALIRLNTSSIGIVGEAGGKPAFLDGGVPYYGWVGAHVHDPPHGGTIRLLGHDIADITQVFEGSCMAVCREFTFSVKGKHILGLSFTLQPRNEALVKVIPGRRGVLDVEPGEWLEAQLNV